MSFQAGICYFDGRDVPPPVTTAIERFVASDLAQPPTTHQQPGIFLAHSASDMQIWAPPDQPHVGLSGIATFDGRLDNRDDLRRVLGANAAGDAGFALAAWEHEGASGLAHLIGDWSLAICDVSRRAVVLASDYAGVRPLYYSADDERVVWSTRLRPLVDWLDAREIDEEYVAAFLAFTGSPDRTPYRGIYPVPTGCAVSIQASGKRTEPFWRLPVDKQIRYARESEYEEHLRDLFRHAVRSRLPAGSRSIAELSGGLDSSTVVAMCSDLIRTSEVAPERVVTLTLEHAGSRDVPFYTAMERFCGFESMHLSADAYPWVTETETGGALPLFWNSLVKHTATLACRMGATTYLTGRLGDDIMGNWWDDSDQVAGLLHDLKIGGAMRQALAWSKFLKVPIALVLWRALLSALPASLNLAPAKRIMGAPETEHDREDSLTPGFRSRTGVSEPHRFFSPDWMHARPELRKHCRSLSKGLQIRRLQTPEPLEHLEYTHPFSHRPLVEFMLSIPESIVCAPGQPRRLMFRAFREHWPPELRQRRSKDEFGSVFLGALRPLAEGMLHEDEPWQMVERGYLNAESLRSRLERLTLSMTCNQAQLRQVILLEFWLRRQAGQTITAAN